ncbi:histidine kinase-like protein [Motilibacter rhizosphaerae]|uniref:Histidine kinase-like protein n=1 Tax=Motilibacter rhizosphaerae TaxID=598652 RepID=A0A4Q7NQK9_9ACTN|nr:ATP-binding protein [Motilibacter rhizosphaerae]RZS87388.1 histidine kinase-like protein [Motilibacter rhizosphaerae]
MTLAPLPPPPGVLLALRVQIGLEGAHALRGQLLAALRRAGSPVDLHDAALVAAELLANAAVHAGGDCCVRAVLEPGVLRVEVEDRVPADDRLVAAVALARVGAPGGLGESGRGLALVSATCSAWGVLAVPGGKVVWAELPR